MAKNFVGGLDFANQAAFEDIIRSMEEDQLRQFMEKRRLQDIEEEEARMVAFDRLYGKPVPKGSYRIAPRSEQINTAEVGRTGYQPPVIDLNRARRQRTGDVDFLEAGPYQAGMDYANPQGMLSPGPTNRVYEGGMDFASLQGTLPPPPTNKASSIVDASLNTGQQIARDQNRASTQGFFSDAREGVSSLFGGLGEALTSPFAKRLLAIMARPEFQSTEGISAGIVNAAYGLAQDEAKAAEKAMQQQRLDNEARRQAFLDKIKLEELGLSRRRAELSEQTEKRIAGQPVTIKTPTKNEYKELESRLEIIPGVEDFISKSSRSWMFGSGESSDVIRRRLIYAANEEAQRKGISFEDAVATLTGLGGSPKSTSTAPQSARPGVKERG